MQQIFKVNLLAVYVVDSLAHTTNKNSLMFIKITEHAYTETSLILNLCNPEYLYNLTLFCIPKRLFLYMSHPKQLTYFNNHWIIEVSL